MKRPEAIARLADKSETIAGFDKRDCRTHHLPSHGCTSQKFDGPPLINLFGSDAEKILALTRERPDLLAPLHPRLPYCQAEVVWAVREEMARSVKDVLARPTRSLLLAARAAIAAAPLVGQIAAAELGRDEAWGRQSAEAFIELSKGYLVKA